MENGDSKMLVLSQGSKAGGPGWVLPALSACASVRGALRPQASPFLQNHSLPWLGSISGFHHFTGAKLYLSCPLSLTAPHPIEMFKVLSNVTTPSNSIPFSSFPASGSQAANLADVQGIRWALRKAGSTSYYISFLCTNKSQGWKTGVKNRKFKVQKEPRSPVLPFPSLWPPQISTLWGPRISLPKSKGWRIFNFFQATKATLLWKTVKLYEENSIIFTMELNQTRAVLF